MNQCHNTKAIDLGMNGSMDMSLPIMWEYCVCLGGGGVEAHLFPPNVGSKPTVFYDIIFQILILVRLGRGYLRRHKSIMRYTQHHTLSQFKVSTADVFELQEETIAVTNFNIYNETNSLGCSEIKPLTPIFPISTIA